MGVYIGAIKDDYSAMQGPAPSGFHVPSKDEWVALIAILKTTFGLENKATTMGTYLKMPTAGNRSNSNSNVSKVGSNGNYWFSTSSYSGYASYLFFNSININPQGTVSRPYGCSVRCFKNSPTIPTSSWTTLYDGSSVATGAGVFYNATDGLISVSGDGQTWYTIQDKNLGATTVYNQGDTLTDANCGYFFQWGNNYGFPHSGAVTTSSTKVDASNYGPGNYYSSSTFITASAGADWSSVKNDNLWGGVTGLMPTSLKNAYIGEYHEIICDFTQGDQGFNLDEVHGGATSGRDGNGFYIKSGYSWGAGARLLIPSTITSVGTPKMIKLYGKNMNVGGGVGISEGIDSKCIRAFGSQITCSPYSGTGAWGTPNNTNVSPLNEDVFVIDFENGICYLESSPSITATIYPNTILTLWNNGTLNLCLLSPNKNYYGYLQKAEFYF